MAEFRKPHGIPGTLVAHIIFVHGLNGDKTKAWLSSTKPKEFWPDWLLDDISGVAVWSLGYPADASYWKRRGGAMALPDRAANILPALIEEPALKSGPIIFVAYSLGGLVVKEVLRLAEAQAPHDQRIADFLRRVRQIVFIGTPHFGSDQASLANLFAVPFRPRETTTGLSRNDPHLRALNTWFRSFVETSNIDVLVLRESKPMRYLGMIVKPDSADPGLSPAMLVIPIAEDHDSIRSPRNRDADVYKRIVAFIDRPFEKRHPDTILADGMASVANRVAEVQSEVRLTRDGLGDLANSLASGIPVTENPVVSAEAERRLWQLRKCRYIPGFEAKNECTRLLHDVRSGELLGASKEIRRRIFAWCSRVVAAVDLAIAQEALTEAQRLGSGEENVIAHAFFLLFAEMTNPQLTQRSPS